LRVEREAMEEGLSVISVTSAMGVDDLISRVANTFALG